jgi:FixJ family two-component response regulator
MAETSRVVAIVDDDPSLLRAVERLLSTRSWTTRAFTSGRQFLSSLTGELPDCLILDLHMPEMGGLDVQRVLLSRGINIPTIIITSNKDAAMREHCISAGAVAFLPKPVRKEELFAALDAASNGRTHQS